MIQIAGSVVAMKKKTFLLTHIKDEKVLIIGKWGSNYIDKTFYSKKQRLGKQIFSFPITNTQNLVFSTIRVENLKGHQPEIIRVKNRPHKSEDMNKTK